MFSVIQPSTYVFSYLPPVQSPLAPRDVNVCPSYPSLMASTFKAAQKACVRSREHRDPLAHKRAEEPERRRQAFLKRVKDAGDDKKWQTRSDQILRKDFLSQKKQRESALALSAVDVVAFPDDDDDDGKERCLAKDKEVSMMDEVLTQEDREFEALVALIDQQQEEHEQTISDYGNDDEDYDRIFMEAVAAAERSSCEVVPGSGPCSDLDQEMDMSSG